MVDQMSGVTTVNNLSGGVNRSATPNTIPEISWSDVANFDIENSAVKTRRGLTKYGAAHRPGCLQFGFSDTQRVHYLRSTGASYMPATASTRATNIFFYARDFTSTTDERGLVTFTDTSGNALAKIYWDDTDYLKFEYREDTGESWNAVTGSLGTKRASITDYVFGARIERNGTTTKTCLYDSSGIISAVTSNSTLTTFTTWSECILGCDDSLNHPEVTWTNVANQALYGLMGELAITKNTSPTATTYATNLNVLPPVTHTPISNRVAYYPLRGDFNDSWALQPSFKPTDIYRSGAGLTHYLVRDNNVPGLSKDPLYNTRSMHLDGINNARPVYGKMQGGMVAKYKDALNSSGGAYTLTADLLPIETQSGTTTCAVWVSELSGTGGQSIYLAYDSPQFTKVKWRQAWNSGTISPWLTTLIPNKKPSKLSFEYSHSGTTTGTMKIYRDTGLVASQTFDTGAGAISQPTVVNLGNSGADTTTVASEYYLSAMILHSAAVGTSWSEKPKENISSVTIYNDTPQPRPVSGYSDDPLAGASYEMELAQWNAAEANAGTKIERTGQEVSFLSIQDLPRYDAVIGAWLFNEVTGFDSATTLTPHGVIPNIKGARSDNTDFYLRRNCAPMWIPDREKLVSSGFLDNAYDQAPDRMANYTPNDSGSRDVLLVRNNSVTSYTGTTHTLNDTYKYTHRLDTQLRGFMFGQSLYLHGQDYKMRYNGLDMFTGEAPSAGVPLSLTAVTNGGSGLRGYYKYAYTMVDKNGYESYPCVATGSTISYRKFGVTCNLQVRSESWMDESIETFRFYRSKGSTTNLTSLTADASPELFFLRELPIETIKDKVGATWFFDTTADDSLGAQPPLPGFADSMPPSKYSALYRDVAYFTGNTYEPTMVYKSHANKPFLIRQADEFRTEDGERCKGVSAVGNGVVAFKSTSRKYYSEGSFTQGKEFINGGCIAPDSLVSMGTECVGLGDHGFFVCNGPSYKDISTIIDGGRAVSSVQYDIDEVLSESDMKSAEAIFHEPTGRYICTIGDNAYVFHVKRRRWMIYRGILGKMIVQGGALYMYLKGRVYKEVSNQGYVGTNKWTGTISSGGLGFVTVTNSSALPTTNEEGLPIYIDKTLYYVTKITNTSGTTYKIEIDTTETFSSGAYALGVIRHYGDTKFFDERTTGRNKWYKGKFVLEHNGATNGQINLRTARNNGSFDDSYDHFQFDTNEDKGECLLRVRSENLALRFEIMDGNQHEMRSYSFPYSQDSIL